MSRPAIPTSALDAFIGALARGATVSEACEASPIGRSTAYSYRRESPEFAERWDDALAAGLDRLEQELHIRAMDRDDPGSSALLMFLLARHRPAVYGRSIEVDVRVETTGSADELRRLLAVACGAGTPTPRGA